MDKKRAGLGRPASLNPDALRPFNHSAGTILFYHGLHFDSSVTCKKRATAEVSGGRKGQRITNEN